MRHGAGLVAALEGMSHPVFRIARELSLNSRSGLTARFLSKKLDSPEEEIEYLVDLNPRLFFTDITRVKIVPEGLEVVKRITTGLENHGDTPSLFRQMRGLGSSEVRRLEELLGVDRPLGKQRLAEDLLNRCYRHPDSVVEYVASRGFSPIARELFDVVWQSAQGVMTVSKLRSLHGGRDHEIEQGLLELFQGFALFEMFRFAAEDRLVRVVGLLSEIRQWREAVTAQKAAKAELKPFKGVGAHIDARELDFSERVCRLVATVAARPARLRGDGELFREDRRRLEEVCSEESDPSISTCLWAAQGLEWLARVDNELRSGNLEAIIVLDRISRHRLLFEWLAGKMPEASSRDVLAALAEDVKPGAWYPVLQFIGHVMRSRAENERPVLRCLGGRWQYVSPSTVPNAERALTRLFEETCLWLGIVDRAEEEGVSLFRLTELGRCLLTGTVSEKLKTLFPEMKGEIIVQPNFDVVVPVQGVDALLTVPLDQFAVRASLGSASVYHLTKESFTQALQDGHDPDAFIEFLLTHNRGGASLPANVMTTLDDWRGGMKRVRVRTLHVLESGDPLVIADLLHRRRFRKYLQSLDPRTVVAYTKISKADLTKRLEKEGFVVS
jgi:hypothetical protein